jgi:mannose-6-phosphate isomerase-like protein (cupin superfamily)
MSCSCRDKIIGRIAHLKMAVNDMRSVQVLCLLAFCTSFAAKAQVLPSSSGACSVSPAGLEGCNWLSALTVRPNKNAENGKTKVFVTRYTLAPGAPLSTPVEGYDNLVVGMNDGELANEIKLPQTHVNITNGSVVLMPKEETYLLRNIGKQNLELLVIEVRK